MAEDEDRRGYGNPPKATRFPPGTSGNSKGRRRKNAPRAKSSASLKSITEDLMRRLQEIVTVIEDGHELKISKQRAFIKSLMESAIKGETRSIAAVVAFSKECRRGSPARPPAKKPVMSISRISRSCSPTSSASACGASAPEEQPQLDAEGSEGAHDDQS